jgi:hypothetical protein
MQSLALALLVLAPGALLAQDAAGTQLWRLAAATLPLPPALATGGVASWWNPAQRDSLTSAALELIQTSATVGASGFVSALRVRINGVGRVGVAYGRMRMSDLVRTTFSPDPDGASIPYFSHAARLHWNRDIGQTTVGAAVAYHETRLDTRSDDRWTLDVGARSSLTDWVVVAAATHFLATLGESPAQDVYGAAQVRLWRGELWTGSGRSTVSARYGVSVGSGLGAAHHLGTGIDVGGVFVADLLVAREGGYGVSHWRPVGGMQLRVGRYRILFAGDAGVRRVGASYRVGLEARIR